MSIAEPLPYDESPYLVCMVDDDSTLRRLLADMLARCGYRVSQFDGPASFLAGVGALQPDLVLLDVEMPLMNGFELCRIMKKKPDLQAVPVMFLSGLSKPQDKVDAFAAGGIDYITKPYQFEEVQVRISTHLELNRLQRELRNQNQKLAALVQAQVAEISASQIATIHALASLVESRDDDTGKHIERVQELCHFLAERLLASPDFHEPVDLDFAELIKWASPLHDIGKVAVSDSILLKPGKLDPAEFEAMKAHTVIGAETLAQVHHQYPNNAFIAMGIDIALSHHERWDGNGYPHGLAGTAIPLSARIMAIMDVYDAMRSDRCYKSALPHPQVLEMIRQGSGTQFDPQLVSLFITWETAIEAVRDKFR